MLKKVTAIIMVVFMMCQLLTVCVSADGLAYTEYELTGKLSDSKEYNTRIFGKDSNDAYRKVGVYTGGGQQFFSAKIDTTVNSAITVSAGDKVKVSFQMSVNTWDYLASDNTAAKVLDVGLFGTTYNSGTYDSGKNNTCIGFDHKAGGFYNFGVNLTGYTKQFVPVNNWATYEIVYTIGGNSSTKDKVSVYVDGKPYVENFPINTYITGVTGINMRTQKQSKDLYMDNVKLVHYPAGYTGAITVQDVLDETKLNSAKLSKLPDGTLHYRGTDINSEELSALAKVEGVSVAFVSDENAADNGRIGYLKFTRPDGTQQFKKVVSGEIIDLLKLDFNSRLSLDPSTEKLVTTANKEGGYMNTMQSGQNTNYELSYKAGLIGKSASNYALEYKPTALNAANSYWGTFFSACWNDNSYSASAMKASGIVSYEFSIRLPDGIPSGKVSAELSLDVADAAGTVSQVKVVPMQAMNNGYVYYNKRDEGFGGNSAAQGYDQMGKGIEPAQWQRYAFVVNTLTDKVSVYRNGQHEYTSQPKKSTNSGDEYDILSAGVLKIYGIGLNTTTPKSTFQVDDVVIRSVTEDYVPAGFTVTSSDGRIDTANGILRTNIKSAEELSEDLALSDGQIAFFEDDAFSVVSTEGNVGNYAIIKNLDETIIYYVEIVEQDIAVAGMDLSELSANDVNSLTVSITNYAEKTKRAVLILAGYNNDRELVCVSALDDSDASAWVSVKDTKELTATLSVPSGSTVTKVKAFLWDDENGYAPLTLSSETK